VPPVCRTHYGGILTAVGRWDRAEEELASALDALEHSYRLMREGPLLRLADLRLRQGRFEEAQRLLEGSESHPSARRTRAAIAHAEGEHELAAELTSLCLGDEAEDDPGCAPVLSLLVDARLARSDTPAATEALARLERLAERTDAESCAAYAALARGRFEAVDEDSEADPVPELQAALRAFGDLGLPLEAARAQHDLARALSSTARQAAITEAQAALSSFERIGAARDADAVVALLHELGAKGRRNWPKGAGGLTKRETEVLALLGEGCSNAAIAERLFISRRTAEHHVANLLSKLELKNRSEAAAYAIRGGRGDP
jgi:DNA-binding CsgD family transcriptional regulator